MANVRVAESQTVPNLKSKKKTIRQVQYTCRVQAGMPGKKEDCVVGLEMKTMGAVIGR